MAKKNTIPPNGDSQEAKLLNDILSDAQRLKALQESVENSDEIIKTRQRLEEDLENKKRELFRIPQYRMVSEEERNRDYNTSMLYREYKNNIEEYGRRVFGDSYTLENDKEYDYLGYFINDPYTAVERSYNRLYDGVPFPREFETVYFPYFNRDSLYSGIQDSRFNPLGIEGGTWLTPNYDNEEHKEDGSKNNYDYNNYEYFLLSPSQSMALHNFDPLNLDEPDYDDKMNILTAYALLPSTTKIVALPTPMWELWNKDKFNFHKDENGFDVAPVNIDMSTYRDFFFEPRVDGKYSNQTIKEALQSIALNQELYNDAILRMNNAVNTNNLIMEDILSSTPATISPNDYPPSVISTKYINHADQAPKDWNKIYSEPDYEELTQNTQTFQPVSSINKESFVFSPINRSIAQPYIPSKKEEIPLDYFNTYNENILDSVAKYRSFDNEQYISPQITEILKDVLPNQYKEQ